MTAFTDDIEELWFLPLVKVPASTGCHSSYRSEGSRRNFMKFV